MVVSRDADSERISFPPGPTEPAWMQTARYARDPVGALEHWHAKYGDLFTVRIVGMPPLVFAAAPGELRQIFTASPEELLAGQANGQIQPIVGTRSILTLDGQEHHRHRRMMLPPFHGERMATYAETIREVTERTMATWPTEKPFALLPHMLQLTLEVILRTVFGIEQPTRVAQFSGLFSELIARWSSPLLPMLALYGVDPIRLAPWLPVSKRKRALDTALRAEIVRREKDGAAGTDIFSLMLSARDEAGQPLTSEELRDELVTLMIAGHETSATTLAWAFERLLVHPRILERVIDEIQASTDENGRVDLGQLDKLTYLDAVLKETLRQRPILAFIARVAAQPFEIAGYRVPEGTYLCPAIHLAHRRSETYPQPDVFDPDRFVGKKFDNVSFLPFGGGGRRCIGMAFAMMEMKVILATVLSQVSLRLEGAKPLGRTLRGVAVTPAGGTRVIKSR